MRETNADVFIHRMDWYAYKCHLNMDNILKLKDFILNVAVQWLCKPLTSTGCNRINRLKESVQQSFEVIPAADGITTSTWVLHVIFPLIATRFFVPAQ